MTQKPNNRYDRDLPTDFYEAETALNRTEALNVLGLVQRREQRNKVKARAIRASYIHNHETF